MAATGYTTREVSRLVGLSRQQVRAYARAGVVGPHRQDETSEYPSWSFSFRDLCVLRMARRLLASGFAPYRVQRALQTLRRHTSAHQPQLRAHLSQAGRRMVASDGATLWDPENGQCLLRFGPTGAATAAPTPLECGKSGAQRPAGSTARQTQDAADATFDAALLAEEHDLEQAYGLYLKVLACDPEHVEGMINIGRLCSANGDTHRAAAYFRQAIRCDGAHPVAHFNLAVTLHDLGDSSAATDAYQAALLQDPHFADAHYNLATLLREAGNHEEAERHFQAYQRLSNSGA